MATNSADLPVQYFYGGDGAKLAYRQMGEGRPLVLIHGFFSTASVNWVRYGHAAKIAAARYRVVIADLSDDRDTGSAEDLAAALPNGHYAVIPGNHMSAVTKPELGAGIAEFLGEAQLRLR